MLIMINIGMAQSFIFIIQVKPLMSTDRAIHTKRCSIISMTNDETLNTQDERRAKTSRNYRKSKLKEQQKFVKISEFDLQLDFDNAVQTEEKLRIQSREKRDKQISALKQQLKQQQLIKRKHRQAVEQFELELIKKRLLSKKQKGQAIITNFCNQSGMIILNEKPKAKSLNKVINLQFSSGDQKIFHRLESKTIDVTGIRKNLFTTKIKKRVRVTNQEFNNNDHRQTSSIPFMSLNVGITLAEKGIQAQASRRRPSNELNRDKFVAQLSKISFKSFIPSVNIQKLSNFSTIEHSSVPNTERQSLELKSTLITTLDSTMKMKESILWRPKTTSQSKRIKVINNECMNQQILQRKLVYV